MVAGPYGPERAQRAVVATTDPATLPEHSTWYLATNLQDTDLAEIVRLYGLRNWVEQSYQQVKHRLGWSQYQVRSDLAIRRHWTLVCCAFSFCWQVAMDRVDVESPPETVMVSDDPAGATPAGRGEIRPTPSWPVALRQVRAWLTPWLWLRRWWRAWSSAPHLPNSKPCSMPSPRATHSRSMTPLESEPQHRTG